MSEKIVLCVMIHCCVMLSTVLQAQVRLTTSSSFNGIEQQVVNSSTNIKPVSLIGLSMIFLDNIDDSADEGADSGNDDVDCRGRRMTMSSAPRSGQGWLVVTR